MKKDTKHIVLFFTQDISLKRWEQDGLLEREIRPYLILAKERGWRVTFLTYGNKTDLQFTEKLTPIQIVPLWGKEPKTRLLKALLAPFALLRHKEALGNAAIYKTNQFWGGWNAVLAKWLWGGRVIARQGYEYLAFAKAQNKPRHQVFIATMLEWFIYRFSDRIVLATEDDKEFAKKEFKFLENRRIDIQPNWIDIQNFSPSPPCENGEADLIYIGRFNAQKNLPTLIRAAARAHASLDLYGSGELEDELKSLANQTKAHIRFMGRIANDKIPEILQRYKIFILPSLFEGNPKVLLEAMACGKAVIGCNVPGVRSLIKDGETGLLSATDEVSLADNITKLLKDDVLRRALGKAARKLIEERYSLDFYLDEEEKRYEQLA